MVYLSFDVGIKNLAYCVLSEEKEIQQWGIINLNKNPICCSNLRKPCCKQSSYVVKGKGDCEDKYYCTAHSKKIKQKKKLNANYDLFELSKTLFTELEALDLSNVKYVLIENQPALKNPTMKSIQMFVYSFFMMKGVMEESSFIEKIHMVNARNKLKVYKGEPLPCPYKEKYKQNKYLSVKYTELMIKNEKDNFIQLFKESSKKDDLADAYLQGIYWIEK